MALLVSQKNEIYSLIEEMDFSPAQFIFEEIPSRYDAVPTALQLAYAPKPEYNFRFDRRVELLYAFKQFKGPVVIALWAANASV